ncbi:MAG: glucose-6-phosphate dehydrogenase assembly protein OpcA [Acidobacteriaceae bacterium]|nr:glucose-6-phosphate dehydrogenase assembly protein OpcA [Acidobacteriaceae bacterium]
MSTSIISPAQPEQILKGLGKLWTSLGQEEKQLGKPTVLRACAMTLIVAADESGGGFSESQTISDLMREHPSRGIVLMVSPEAEKPLEARVLAQCWKPFGKAQQICCEQIEITARPDSWPNVGPTLIGLTVPDLPVVFWCRHKAALNPAASENEKAGLQAILDLSTKVIIDTKDIEASQAFQSISRLQGNARIVADLSWTRLTRWRQPIAQIFDNPARTNKFFNFREFEIAHTGETPGPGEFYAAGWLSSFANSKVSFKAVRGFGPGLHSITLRSPEETITFERTGPECMMLWSTNGRKRAYSYSEPALYNLMHEELSVLGFDPVFDSALHRATELVSQHG